MDDGAGSERKDAGLSPKTARLAARNFMRRRTSTIQRRDVQR